MGLRRKCMCMFICEKFPLCLCEIEGFPCNHLSTHTNRIFVCVCLFIFETYFSQRLSVCLSPSTSEGFSPTSEAASAFVVLVAFHRSNLMLTNTDIDTSIHIQTQTENTLFHRVIETFGIYGCS